MPYIYSADELSRIVAAAAKLPRTYALRRATYATLFGLIASTGLRISEALDIRLSDVQPDGVLLIRRGKGGKSRLIPLHTTAATALNAYLDSRLMVPTADDHLFLSTGMRAISRSMANYTFRRLAFHAGITQTGTGLAEFMIFDTRSLLDLWRSVQRGVRTLLLISLRWRRTLGMWISPIPIGISRPLQN
jgi:integrase